MSVLPSKSLIYHLSLLLAISSQYVSMCPAAVKTCFLGLFMINFMNECNVCALDMCQITPMRSECKNHVVSLSVHWHACQWPVGFFMFLDHDCITHSLHMRYVCLVCQVIACFVRFRQIWCCRLWLMQNWWFEVNDGDISWCECTNTMYKWWGS